MSGSARLRMGVCAALVAAVVLVYSPALQHEFLNFDDDTYVTKNAPLQGGLSLETLRWALFNEVGANWFPLTLVSYLVDFELHGLSPAGVHATNLALHALATVLLFLAWLRMTGSPWRSAFVAAVFALHPLHVETVAWAAERKGVLAGCLWMATLYVYSGSGREGPSPGRLAAVALLLGLGLMAKGLLFTLPFVLLLLDVWPLGRLADDAGRPDLSRLRRPLLEKLPLFVLVAAAVVATVLAQHGGGTTVGLERLSMAARLENAAVSYAAYLGHYFAPRGLAVFYPHPEGGLGPLVVAAASLLLVGLSGLAWTQRRQRPYLLVGWLWYLGTLVPMIGLVQLGSQAMADRYTYVPMIGITVALTWTVADALAPLRHGRAGAAALAGALLVTMAALTTQQLRHWKDSVALLGHAAAVTENNHVAHGHLAEALVARGQVGQATAHYREAVRIRPEYLEAVNNLAWILATHPEARFRSSSEAVALAERAVRIAGGGPMALDTLAAAQASAGRYAEAARTQRRAIAAARKAGLEAFAVQLRGRLILYQNRTPFRESP